MGARWEGDGSATTDLHLCVQAPYIGYHHVELVWGKAEAPNLGWGRALGHCLVQHQQGLAQHGGRDKVVLGKEGVAFVAVAQGGVKLVLQHQGACKQTCQWASTSVLTHRTHTLRFLAPFVLNLECTGTMKC